MKVTRHKTWRQTLANIEEAVRREIPLRVGLIDGILPDQHAAEGEELDFAVKLHLGDKLYQVASTLHDGEISDPVADYDGVHILIMQRHQFPKVADFPAVRDRVYLDFRNAAANHATEENLSLLRRQASIILAPGQAE